MPYAARTASTAAWIAAAIFFAPSAEANEQGPVLELANEPGFTERFAGNAQVSGQFLSGLAYEDHAGQLDLKQLRLSYTRPSDEMPGLLCVRVTSDDGRYWASNMYRSSGTFATAPAVPLETKYSEQLMAYGPSNLLMLATFSESCNETAGKTFVPGVFGSPHGGADLIAYVNVSQSKVSASLVDEAGAVVEKVNCKKPDDGAKVTFSHLCRFSPPKLVRGTYKLIVGVKGLTGQTTEQEYAVHLE